MCILLADGEALPANLFKVEFAVMDAIAGARHGGELLHVLGPGFLGNDSELVDRTDVLHSGEIESVGQNVIGEGAHGVARGAKGEGRSDRQRVVIEQAGIVERLQAVAPRGALMAVAKILLLRRRSQVAGEQTKSIGALQQHARAAHRGMKIGIGGDQRSRHGGRPVQAPRDLRQMIGVHVSGVILLSQTIVIVD